MTGAAGPGRQRFPRRAAGHAVEPAAHERAVAQARGLAREDEEGGLEGVLRILLVAEHAPAEVEDHRPVPPHQGRESRVAARRNERLHERLVRGVAGLGRLRQLS